MAEKELCGFDLYPFAPVHALGRSRQPPGERRATLVARLAEANEIYQREVWHKGTNHPDTCEARRVIDAILREIGVSL